MRGPGIIGQVAAFALMVAFVWVGGRSVVERVAPPESIVLDETGDMDGLFDEDGNVLPAPDAAEQQAEESATAEDDLQRMPAREPLSEIGQALPPPPPPPELDTDWQGTVLYKPVAEAAGRFEAMGYQVAVSGLDIVPAEEKCTYEGQEWDCGIRARTAFRSFLRGRAPTCEVPAQAGAGVLSVRCRIGKQDIGTWLVENGWARATADGPYVDAGKKAKDDERGIFGPRPDTSIITLPEPVTSSVEPAPHVEYAPMPSIVPIGPSE